MGQKVLTLSWKVDECKPLAGGVAMCYNEKRDVYQAGAYTRPLFVST
jgi:hypothetical protein